MKSTVVYIGLILAAITFAVVMMLSNDENARERIDDWAEKKELTIVYVNSNATIIGSPFYYANKGQFIYKITTKEDGVWWMRPGDGLFLNDKFEKDKE